MITTSTSPHINQSIKTVYLNTQCIALLCSDKCILVQRWTRRNINMYGEKPRKEKAYIMAQAHQQLQVSGKKTPAIRIIL